MFGFNALAFRRCLRGAGLPAPRRLIARGCIELAADMIRDGLKIEAARRLVGWRNKTRFNEHFKRCFGRTPSRIIRSAPASGELGRSDKIVQPAAARDIRRDSCDQTLMKATISAGVAVLSITATVVGAAPQQAATTAPPTAQAYTDQIKIVWKGLHGKILAMAKDWPEDKYEWRPHPDSRTMLDEFRHVTIGLEYSSAQLRGEKFDYMSRIEQDTRKPKTRASVLSDMQSAIVTSYELVDEKPAPSLIFWIDHQAEHYGKLVSNYRMNGIVPPISRR